MTLSGNLSSRSLGANLPNLAGPLALPGRAVGISMVALVHLVISYALITGLAGKIGENSGTIILTPPPDELEQPKPQTPPPPDPAYRDVRVDAPVPDLPVSLPDRSGGGIWPQPPAGPPETGPVVSGGGQSVTSVLRDPAPTASFKRWAERLQATYPSASIRYEEEGRVVVKALIDAQGAVVDVKLVSSSGYARLDEHVIRRLKGARNLFAPATRNGTAIEHWIALPAIVFQIQRG